MVKYFTFYGICRTTLTLNHLSGIKKVFAQRDRHLREINQSRLTVKKDACHMYTDNANDNSFHGNCNKAMIKGNKPRN